MKKILYLLLMVFICIGCEHEVQETENVQGIGVFSVSETKKVMFSPGNLQYHRATDTWHFADEQTDLLIINNLNSPIYHQSHGIYISALRLDSLDIDPEIQLGSKIDLFGWGTGYNPIMVSQSVEDYVDFVDWGYHQIDNDKSMQWHTLDYDEWDYLLHKRPNADSLWAFADVKGFPGKIFLPDGWVCPDGVSYEPVHGNVPVLLDGVNHYNSDDWAIMEKSGAVFLRFSCYRTGVQIYPITGLSAYWVSSYTDDTHGVALEYAFGLTEKSRSLGYSVRLVKEIKQ